jgi:hypothetical protein
MLKEKTNQRVNARRPVGSAQDVDRKIHVFGGCDPSAVALHEALAQLEVGHHAVAIHKVLAELLLEPADHLELGVLRARPVQEEPLGERGNVEGPEDVLVARVADECQKRVELGIDRVGRRCLGAEKDVDLLGCERSR